MLIALYWTWNYTTWMTNWFDTVKGSSGSADEGSRSRSIAAGSGRRRAFLS
jgi:hypothetical protein